MKRLGVCLCLSLGLFTWVVPETPRSIGGLAPLCARAEAPADGALLESAVYLLRQSMTVDRRGTHNVLLKAIRHMRDPAARPLFRVLAESEHPGLKIHGILGLAELSDPPQVDLARIATIEDPALQSMILTAALDDGLLDLDHAEQMLAWGDLPAEVKLLLAVRLLEAGRFDDVEMLREAMTGAKKLGGSALAALLLTQLGDSAGPTYLSETLDTSEATDRDAVRAMLLQTALRHGFDRVGEWALKLAENEGNDPYLRLLALRTAMRFGQPGATELWLRRYQDSESPADRVRLALTALRVVPWADGTCFDVLAKSDDPLLEAIGTAGSAIVNGSDTAGEALARLAGIGQPSVNEWVLAYAREHAPASQLGEILVPMIVAYRDAPSRAKAVRLDEAVEAVQVLYERSPETAAEVLPAILSDPETPTLLAQAVLLGLVRTGSPEAVSVIDGLDQIATLSHPDTEALVTLLLARSGRTMTERQLETLSLQARGGGRLEDSLRVQAAWYYLKRAGLTDRALSLAMGMD